jgi:hypothetical protein
MICFGKITMTADNFPDEVLLDCFDSNKLKKYETTGTLWVDEAHKVAVPGGNNLRVSLLLIPCFFYPSFVNFF